jgi:hypothetical protein
VTDPVVGSVKDVASDAASLGLAGPVNGVVVTEGRVSVSQ